jgi:hypothetical protein
VRLLDWIIGREPVATATGAAAVVTAGLGVAAAFGLPITETQIAALGAFAAAVAGLLARAAVTPVNEPAARRALRHLNVSQPPGDTVAGDSRLEGSVPLAAILFFGLILVIIAGVAFTCDAAFDDEDEPGDVGISRVYDHDYDDGWGGPGSDGNSGGEYEGGRSGDDYDGDGDGNRCRNFCFYGVPYPGQPGTAPA